jgi:hypothetical protein
LGRGALARCDRLECFGEQRGDLFNGVGARLTLESPASSFLTHLLNPKIAMLKIAML